MRRVVRTQKMLADMIHIPATMLPLDFLKFRNQSRVIDGDAYQRGLSPASGTESYQFRELEIVSGLKGNVAHHEMLRGNDRLPTRFLTSAQATRLQQPSLPEAFARLLERRGVGDVIVLFTPADQANPNADLAELADLLLEFDEFSHLWRVNHVAMVQSMIGRKSGTGFLGPEYLKETIGQELQGADERLLPTAQVRPRFFEPPWEAMRNRAGQKKAGLVEWMTSTGRLGATSSLAFSRRPISTPSRSASYRGARGKRSIAFSTFGPRREPRPGTRSG
jgi:tryptophan 2,3-dioxygenase